MQKNKATKATLRFEWSKDNSKQKLFIDYYPPIERNGKLTRREFLARTITPLRTKNGEPILKNKGVFEAKANDVVSNGVLPRIPQKFDGKAKYYSYSAIDEDAIRYCQTYIADRQKQCSAYDNANEEQKKLFFVEQQTSQTFESFFNKVMEKKKDNTQVSYKCALNWFKRFERDVLKKKDNEEICLNEISQDICDKYRMYIDKCDMKQNSKSLYFGKFKVVINALNDKRLIEHINVEGFQMEETEREYLTLEEVKRLAETPYKFDYVRRMCLFSAMTGLRISDLINLRWGDIEETNNGYIMHIRTRKTRALLNNDISQEAYELCGKRGENNDRIFPTHTTSEFYTSIATNLNGHIERWVKKAGIKKRVSCHTFRHTYAVLQLEHGTSIETIRELMGHKNLNTTLIYAKVLDDKKKKASTAISLK